MSIDFDKLNTCAICNYPFGNIGHFYRKHKITASNYFETHWPRVNPHTQKKLQFLDFDSYFLNDFDSKDQMREYFRKCSDGQIVEYCKDLFERRKNIKKWIYTPSFVELKSVFSPSTIFYDKILFGGYYEYAKSLDLVNKFIHTTESFSSVPEEDLLIEVDSREQKSYNFKHFQVKTLPFGDYTIAGSSVYVERKSLIDFIGSFGKDVQRLKDELWRAKQAGAYIIVLIEEKFDFALNFDKIQYKNRGRATPEFIFHNVRDIMQTFDNVQFVFGDNRSKSKNLVLFFLANEKNIRFIDIQEYLLRNLA